jgi:hypothetical protein
LLSENRDKNELPKNKFWAPQSFSKRRIFDRKSIPPNTINRRVASLQNVQIFSAFFGKDLVRRAGR